MAVVLYPGVVRPVPQRASRASSRLPPSSSTRSSSRPSATRRRASRCSSLEEREEMIEESMAHLDNVRVDVLRRLLVEVAHERRRRLHRQGPAGRHRLRQRDAQAQMNLALSGVHTLFIPTASARLVHRVEVVREIARFGGDVRRWCRRRSPSASKEKLRAEIMSDPGAKPLTDQSRPRPSSCCGASLEMIAGARPMPLSSSVMINKDEVWSCSRRRSPACPTSSAPPAGCSRSARSSWPRSGARPTTSSTRPAPAPSGWCSAPRSCKAAEPAARRIVEDAEDESRRLRHECRGLLRPEAGQLRDRPRADDQDRAVGPRAAAG